ncbi:hypothetical protein SUGI_1103200 [Cryptomeria japonica]|nr:hypothetical protein SUGI_1103200 [Cryptomeria japonica]
MQSTWSTTPRTSEASVAPILPKNSKYDDRGSQRLPNDIREAKSPHLFKNKCCSCNRLPIVSGRLFKFSHHPKYKCCSCDSLPMRSGSYDRLPMALRRLFKFDTLSSSSAAAETVQVLPLRQIANGIRDVANGIREVVSVDALPTPSAAYVTGCQWEVVSVDALPTPSAANVTGCQWYPVDCLSVDTLPSPSAAIVTGCQWLPMGRCDRLPMVSRGSVTFYTMPSTSVEIVIGCQWHQEVNLSLDNGTSPNAVAVTDCQWYLEAI